MQNKNINKWLLAKTGSKLIKSVKQTNATDQDAPENHEDTTLVRATIKTGDPPRKIKEEINNPVLKKTLSRLFLFNN